MNEQTDGRREGRMMDARMDGTETEHLNSIQLRPNCRFSHRNCCVGILCRCFRVQNSWTTPKQLFPIRNRYIRFVENYGLWYSKQWTKGKINISEHGLLVLYVTFGQEVMVLKALMIIRNTSFFFYSLGWRCKTLMTSIFQATLSCCAWCLSCTVVLGSCHMSSFSKSFLYFYALWLMYSWGLMKTV